MLLTDNIAVIRTALAASLLAAALLIPPTPRERQSATPAAEETPAASGEPQLITIPAGTVRYRLAGEYLRDGKSVAAPLASLAIEAPIRVMKSQVSVAEYQRCVDDRACQPTSRKRASDGTLPVVGVSWHDASAYAAWLSRRTGLRYRLPTDREWVYLAAERAPDQASIPEDAPDNPARRWISRYELESSREGPAEKDAKPLGSFGANSRSLLDLAGNVWEWTDTCYERVSFAGDSAEPVSVTANCGVRVVEGQHRSYMVDFVRDPRTGGCAVGVPPSNLGFRLVRDDQARGPLIALGGRLKQVIVSRS